jgi:predicted porin
MHKTVIALAIAGLAAAPAFADSNVTIYGSVDYGFGARSGNSGLKTECNSAAPGPGCSKQEFASGVSVPNRLGFKGSEDLGNGTKAIFELEAGFLADTGTNSIPGPTSGSAATPVSNATLQAAGQTGGGMFRRHSWVGLTGDWGTVLGGRVDGARYGVATKYDPFQSGGVANMGSLQVHATRADNAIAYVTPNVEGLYAVLAYTSSLVGQERAYNTGDTRLWVVQPKYVMGPVSVTLNYEHATAHNSGNNTKINIYVVGAWYDFGVAKLTGYWEHVKTDTDAGTPTSGALSDQTSWMVGGIVPITENDNFRASYIDYTDKTAAQDSCRKWGIGGTHFLSKRTNFYADYASISQRDKGACTIQYTPTGASVDAGAGSNGAGVGTRGFDAGIVHRF